MTFVATIAGLRGPHSNLAKESFTTGLVRKHVGNFAEVTELSYQSTEDLLPSSSESGNIIARQMNSLQKRHNSGGIVIATCTGTKAFLNALPLLDYAPHIILKTPVLDLPVKLIGLARHQNRLADLGKAIMDDTRQASFPLAVPKAEGRPALGYIDFTQRHLIDTDDYRLLQNTDEEYGDMQTAAVHRLKNTGRSAAAWQEALHNKIPSLTLLIGDKDPYCTLQEAIAFKAIAQPVTAQPIREVIWHGGHHETGPDRRADIVAAVQIALRTLKRPLLRTVLWAGVPKNG